MVVKVFSGPGGTFNLYSDSGTGLGYTKGQFTRTAITDVVGPTGGRGVATASRVTIGPSHGHYPGAPVVVGYHLEMVDLTQPSRVTLNGHGLSRRGSGSDTPGWHYEAGSATLVVVTPSLPTNQTVTVVASGGLPVDRPEPPTPSS
jgi:hypothetical protein